MPIDHRAQLRKIKTFTQLIAYLRDEMGWPIANGHDFEDLTFEYTPEELGIDAKNAAKIQEIKRLRPLSAKQPWGIFFVKFEPKKLPVVALRRILSQVALKKRASANSAERAAWAADDLLFVSNYGEGDQRQISFAHFSQAPDGHDLPTLKVLGWDNRDTPLHLDAVARELTEHLAWPGDELNTDAWRTRWRAAFTLRHREVVTTSRELSIRLAELARTIRDRISTALAVETERGPLTKLMMSFQTALVHDLDPGGFADMYAQTIAYGLLSARISDPTKKTADDFAAHMRTNPFMRELMETFLKVGGRHGKAGGPGIDFDELGVSEIIELLDDANMEAVVRDFGDRNPQEDPVIHFYELFLKEYDAQQRMQRGVFYTPRPVVSYIVRSVDVLLRTELGLADGLADITTWGEMAERHQGLEVPDGVSPEQDFVQILDPATGTGTFLVEIIDLIHKTLVAKWRAQGLSQNKIVDLWNEYVPHHLLTRLHGYELLMAPYAIAHLKIGLKLYETGYRFGSDERARVYLTNALDPAGDRQFRLELLPALAVEAEAVSRIKEQGRFSVVVGNPPYSLLSANMEPQHRALIEDYKFVDGVRIQERGALQLEKNLNDDYVKFTRLSQLAIVTAGVGVSGLITNHSFLDNPTMRGMRWSLLQSSSRMWLHDLHGNTTKQERTPDGSDDVNVFQIKQGVAIALSVRLPNHGTKRQAWHYELWGTRERKEEWLGTNHVATHEWKGVSPTPELFLFVPQSESLKLEFRDWPSLPEVMPLHGAGYITARDHLVIDLDRDALVDRISRFKASRLEDSALLREFAVAEKKGWDVSRARKELRHIDISSKVIQTNYRPFDTRWMFFDATLVWGRSWPTMQHVIRRPDNLTLLATRMTKDQWDVWVARTVSSHKAMSAYDTNSVFPLHLANDTEATQQSLVMPAAVNLTPQFLGALVERLERPKGGLSPAEINPEEVFQYLYAVFRSARYRDRYAEFLKVEFPRVPLPGSAPLFHSLASLGGELVSVHLLEAAKVSRFITEVVGHGGGCVGTVTWSDDTVWINNARATGFKGVAEDVWNFRVGGYQVCSKWLKERKGRALSIGEVRHFQQIVVAIDETIRITRLIDDVIERHGGWPGAFQCIPAAGTSKIVPFRPRIVVPKPDERFVASLPLVPLRAAAGAFGEPQQIEDDTFEWVAVDTRHRLRPGMFVAQVVGKSMEPAIPDGAFCLFRAPVEGTREGKNVLVQLRDATDPETNQRYTVKRYESQKAAKGDSWRHETITLKPLNPDFEPIVLTGKGEGELNVIAELLEVLGRRETGEET
jgi:SOS-response transcriptional repressor LexA